MIQVFISHGTNALRLEATGHAMTAEPGRDLVCAAVSAVVYGFAKAGLITAKVALPLSIVMAVFWTAYILSAGSVSLI